MGYRNALTGLIGCESEIPTSEPITIGHRGLPMCFKIPKNHLTGFWRWNYSVETDILMAAEDPVMIFHDPEISRLTNMTQPLTEKTPTEIKRGIYAKSGGTGLTLYDFMDLYKNKFNLVFFI